MVVGKLMLGTLDLFDNFIELEEAKLYSICVGKLKLSLVRQGRELHVAYEIGSMVCPCAIEHSEDLDRSDLEWQKFILPEGERAIRLSPVLPAYPLVIRPKESVTILPFQKYRFIATIPLRIQLLTINRQELFCKSVEKYSFTWFGDASHEGELAFALRTPVLNQKEAFEFADSEYILCPVTIINGSEVLEFKRSCIYMDYLAVFESEGRLWTNKIEIRFRGINERSIVDYAKRPPQSLVKDPVCLSMPREKETSIVRKSFSFMKQITEFK